MAVLIAPFAGEFAALAAWTGRAEQTLRDDEDYRASDREHLQAWDGDQISIRRRIGWPSTDRPTLGSPGCGVRYRAMTCRDSAASESGADTGGAALRAR